MQFSKKVIGAIVQAVNANNMTSLYQFLSPSLKTLFENPTKFADSFSQTGGTTISSASITGEPILKNVNGVNFAVIVCKVNIVSSNGVSSSGNWALEFDFERGNWWFFGTGSMH